jgi:SAM-dependent methyltransferase
MNRSCLGYRVMLQDRARVTAYRRAIAEVVREGDVVLDLGSGTGLLGFFACQAGARRVYAIEQNDTIECARKLAAANGYQDKVVFVRGNSTTVELPEQVDAIVSEMLGYYCLEEDLTRFVVDARQRFLKPGGALLPERAWMFLAPVEASDIYERHIAFWGHSLEGLDYSIVRPAAADERYVLSLPAAGLLAKAECVKELDFDSVGPDVALNHEVRFAVEWKGILHGLAGWFDAQLSPRVRLTTAPDAEPTHWHQTFFPVAEPVPVSAGDAVIAQLIAFSFGRVFWQWRVEVLDADGRRKARFRHTNFVPARKDLVVQMPDYRPRLADIGRVTRFVLGACDGMATMREIARDLRCEFPALCPTEEAARHRVWSALRGQVEITERLGDFAAD